MDIGELLADGGVVLRSGASSKRQALHTVAEAAAQVLGLPESRILEALLEREALGSTGLGSGVAVPHARLDGIARVTAVFVRLDTPVAYGAVDDQPVDLLFALFAPPPWPMNWSRCRFTDLARYRPARGAGLLELWGAIAPRAARGCLSASGRVSRQAVPDKQGPDRVGGARLTQMFAHFGRTQRP